MFVQSVKFIQAHSGNRQSISVYAKDISRKVSSALRSKMENGDFIGAWEKYGYIKNPNNKNQLIINPETAPVVKQIFLWRSEGMSYMGINKKLNDSGILSPGQYKANRGIVTNNNQKDRVILWNKHMITEILKDITYLGHLAQRKASQCLYAGISFHRTEEQDWIIVENTHEPIIEQELFDKVQAINSAAAEKSKANSGKYDHLPKAVNIYGKKFTCADCGSVMKLVRSFSTKKDKVYFTFKCPTYAEHGTRACNAKKMRKADLDEAVLSTIQAQLDLFVDKVKPHIKKKAENLFPFYCAHCGRKLQRTFGTDVHFYCVTPYWDTDEELCKSVRWDRTDIEEVVLASLKAQIAVMTVESVGKTQNTISEGTLLRQRLEALTSELESGDTQKVQSYLDYREGRITKEDFIVLRSEREKRMEELKVQIVETEAAYEDFLEKENQTKQEQTIIERTSSMNDEALKELMYDAVERINVTDNQNIEIIWKFDDLFATA